MFLVPRLSDYLDLFEYSPSDFVFKKFSCGSGRQMRIDIVESDANYELKADLPGVKLEDIDINVEKQALVIKAKRESNISESGKTYRLTERNVGSLTRTLPLYEDMDSDNIKATYKDGVLSVIIPKVVTVEHQKRIEITT